MKVQFKLSYDGICLLVNMSLVSFAVTSSELQRPNYCEPHTAWYNLRLSFKVLNKLFWFQFK